MPVSGLRSFITMVLILVRLWTWDILGRGLDLISEAIGLGVVPPEALGCLVFELTKI